MINYEDIPEEIIDLIGSHDFEALSSEQQRLVESHMSKSDYQSMRDLISTFQEVDESLRFTTRKSESTKEGFVITKLLMYSIPLYQVAAIGLLLIMAYFIVVPNSDEPQPKNANSKSMAEYDYPEELIFEL